MLTIDPQKRWKQFYRPSAKEVTFVDVPPLHYLMMDGKGDPHAGGSFLEAMDTLYSLSYALKYIVKKSERKIDYRVMPLEGLWWADDPQSLRLDCKDAWKWTLLMAQPDFITDTDLLAAREAVRKKKKSCKIESVRFEMFAEGNVAQILYMGHYLKEQSTLDFIHETIRLAGKKPRGKHHEIYISDLKRTAPERRKTILRHPVE